LLSEGRNKQKKKKERGKEKGQPCYNIYHVYQYNIYPLIIYHIFKINKYQYDKFYLNHLI